MRLRDSDNSIAALVALARRETECCPFFRFGLEITADGTVFTASVPTEAVSILQRFAALASSQ
jgi:hypothetical protein